MVVRKLHACHGHTPTHPEHRDAGLDPRGRGVGLAQALLWWHLHLSSLFLPLSLNGCYWSCNLLIREIEVDLPETVQNFSKDMKNENLNNFTQSTQPPPVASDETVQDAKEKMSKYTSALERIANPAETEPNPAEEPGIEEKEKLNKYVKALEQITENYEQVKDIASQ